MRVVFDDEALADLQGIRAWIAQDSPRAADALIKRIFDKGRTSAHAAAHTHPGTRELIEGSYIIVYEAHEERGEIVVLAVVHGAQDREAE